MARLTRNRRAATLTLRPVSPGIHGRDSGSSGARAAPGNGAEFRGVTVLIGAGYSMVGRPGSRCSECRSTQYVGVPLVTTSQQALIRQGLWSDRTNRAPA